MRLPKGQPWIRILIYVVISVFVGILGAIGLTVYFRGLTVPSSILNSHLTQRIAARYQMRYRLDSLRIGCLHSNCPGDIDVGATDIEINTPEPLRIHVNNTKLARRTPVSVVGLEIRSGTRPPAISIGDLQIAAGAGRVVADRLRIEFVPNDGPSEIASLEFDATTKKAIARTIRVQSRTRPPLNIEEFGFEGWQRSPNDGWLLIDRVNARGMKLDLQGGTNVTSFCGQLPASDAMDQALGPFRPLLPLVRDVFNKLRGDLLRLALSMGVLILVLKFLSVLWLRRMLARLALSIIPAAAPFAVYFGFRETLPARQLILAAGGVSVFLAIICFLFVYRKARKWYHRFEPFVADLAAVAIVLPLLASGYELPATPAPFAGLRLDRIDVTDVAGQSNDGVQLQIPQTSLQNLRLAFPGSGNDRMQLDLLSGQIREVNMSAPLLRITANDMRIDEVSASYDTNQRELGDVSARVKVGGLVESSRFQRELRNIEFLRGVTSRPNRVTFDADMRASAHPRDCTADYTVAADIVTEPVKLTALAVGDTQRVNIRTVRTLPGSPIQIGGGAGEVVLSASPRITFALKQVGGSIGASQVSVAAMGISASSQMAAITLGHSNIRQTEGWEIQFDNASITGSRRPNAVAVPVELKTRIDNIRIENPQDRASIQADFPALETTISGQTTRETIPSSFQGTVAFRVLGANSSNDRLGTDRPISVSVDIYKGLLDITQQEVRVRESVLSETSLELPVRFQLAGRLSSLSPTVTAALSAEVVLPHFETIIGATRVSLNEVRSAGRVDVDDRGVSAGLNFGTGWNSVQLQPEPAAFCLDEISRLDMSATGRISKIAGITLPSSLNRSAAMPCVSLPSLPEAFRFRLSGAIPSGAQGYAVQLEKDNGSGIRVKNIETEIESLQIRAGHLEDIHTHANIAGIGNLEREGTLGLRSELRRNATRFQLTSTLLNAGTPLLDATLSSAPARVTLDARQHVGADQMLDPFQVFLPDLASRLGGIAPKARLARFHAEANFENSTLLDAAAVAQFEPGSLLSADSPHLKLDLSTTAGDPGPTFQINLGRRDGPQGTRRITTAIDVRGANVHAVSDQNDSAVKGSINIEAKGSVVGSRAPSVNPILNNVLDVNAGLSRQFSNIAELLRSKETPEPLTDVNWNLRLTQSAPSRPLLRIENDSLQFRFEAGSFDASWNAAGRTKMAGSGALESTLTLDDDHLLLDAVAPVKLSYSQEEGPVTQLESNLPLQVAFAPRLKEALQKTEKLWSDDFYSKFWLNHSKFANTAFTPPVDLNEVALGPVSLRQVRFPEKSLQVAVGYSDALQVRLPISGRALFGVIDGGLEFSLATSRANAALDTRLNLDLRGIQAGAIRTTRDGSQSPIVEDEFDGKVSLRVDGLTTDRDTLPVLLAGKLSRNEIEKIGISIHMNRSPEAADLRGVLQSSSQVQINLVNDVLNRIVKNLNLTAPPRALTYTDLSLRFDVDHGQVQTTGDLLKIGGLQLFSSNFVDVTGEVRAHAGRPGERILLGDVIKMLSGLTGSEAGAQ